MIGIRSLVRFKTTDVKKNLGDVFKQMNKDNKKLFGDLLETNKIRKKRLKIEDQSLNDKNMNENNYLNQLKSKIKPISKGKNRSKIFRSELPFQLYVNII